MTQSPPVREVSRAPQPEADASELRDAGFELLEETAPQGLVRRLLTTHRHLLGLLFGGLLASVRVRDADPSRSTGSGFVARRLAAWCVRPFLDRKLVEQPFPVQFRRRLEALGPTYIKLGQILSLREDLLPPEITAELKNLLDRLPVVSFERFLAIVNDELGRPPDHAFAWIDPVPLASASIAQIHRATTHEGDDVILKAVKPGIRETLRRDAILLKSLGRFLQIFLARYQPRRVIAEFFDYTTKEVDLRREADNAETFSANFKDSPGVVFPRIYRQYSSRGLLCMEYLEGMRPDDPQVQAMPSEDRDHIVDLGAGSIIRMLYRDGFFHADLHPANLLVLSGVRCGFIDLGMVGRFDDEVRRVLLYYYYCLVMGEAEYAARYLASAAQPGPGADPGGFRRAVVQLSRRWSRSATFEDFSLAQLILESVAIAGQYRMYFPVEMVLMVKALVTFEGVGRILEPGLDVAAVSRRHISRIFMSQFNPLRIAREGLRSTPEIVDTLAKVPLLITEGLRFLEKSTRQPPENPLAGLRGTIMAGCCLVAGAILVAFEGPWPLWSVLFLLSLVLALRRGP
jgi:ubiquinone biosynthesis protein